MRPIKGDPLTGALPATRLIILEERKPAWPLTPDPMAATVGSMRTNRIAYVRTRFGIRRWQIRVVSMSRARGPNRGRHYFVGMTRRGWCRSTWVDRVIRVESVQKAIGTG